jgi:ABC-type nitrate/sulfonate/bicarbonate transport system substrate-binding protein
MIIARKLLLAISLLIASVLCPAELKAQSRPRIVIGHASMSSVVLTLWAAQDKGFFAKNNIDAQLVFIPGSPTLIATLNTGDVHFGFTGGTATLGAAVAGLDVRMIAAFANRVQSELVTRPEIKTAADLRGKRIGVTSIGGTGWMSALLILEQIGINAERDKMQLTSFGDQRVISQALETGTIQGAALAGVFSRKLARAGYWIPGEPDKIPLTGTGLVVKADYLHNQAAISRNVLRSLIEGHAYVLNPGNKASVTEILTKRLGLTDPSAAADGYEDYVGGVVRKPYVGVEGLKNIQRFMKQRNPKIAELNLEKLIDESFLREFERSGFLDQQFGVKSGVK